MQWKPIKDYEDRYMVSDTGLIKAKERMIPNNLTGKLYKKPEIILKPNTVAFGYQQVSLYKDGKRKCKYVHVLVMETFKGKKPLGYEINHIDEDKTNNSLNNLEFLTPIENNNYGTRKLRQIAKTTNGKKSKRVKGTHIITGEVIIFPSMSEAKRQGYGNHIADAVRGKRKHCKGYKWELLEAPLNE